jgi:hypothetical protein
LRSMFGRSITLNLIANARTGHVKKPVRKKALTPRMTNCIEVILTGLSI